MGWNFGLARLPPCFFATVQRMSSLSLGKILVIHPEGAGPPDSLEILQQIADVHVADDLEAALAALASGSFDLVVGSSVDLLERRAPDSQGQLAAVLEAIGQGVGIFDLTGRMIWSNGRAREYPSQVWDRVGGYCAQYAEGDARSGSARRPGLLSLVIDEERYFDASITPVGDETDEAVRWVAAVSDVTRARRLQKKMDAIDNAGRELVRVDAEQIAKLDVPRRLELLEQKVLRYTRELLDFDNFAIRLLDKDTGKLELILCAGLNREARELDIYASPENSGISGYVAATGRSYICPDIQSDPRYLVGIDDARSSLTVPLRLHDQVIGVLNIESDRVAGFSEDDRQFAEIFGRYVAIALHILEVLVLERYTATGRLADNVSAEIAGPLGDILADSSTLMEDYIGHDDLRRRLQTIIDNVVTIKETVKHAAQPADGILGAKPKETRIDPLLAGKHVLVVDDEETILLAVHDVLTRSGCEVETARDGKEAMAMIARRPYDLVVSDIRMPGHSGYEIFAAIKQRRPDCPVIFMTGFGYDPNHSIIRAHAEGLASVLYKPFKVDQLLDDVRAAVAPDAD